MRKKMINRFRLSDQRCSVPIQSIYLRAVSFWFNVTGPRDEGGCLQMSGPQKSFRVLPFRCFFCSSPQRSLPQKVQQTARDQLCLCFLTSLLILINWSVIRMHDAHLIVPLNYLRDFVMLCLPFIAFARSLQLEGLTCARCCEGAVVLRFLSISA